MDIAISIEGMRENGQIIGFTRCHFDGKLYHGELKNLMRDGFGIQIDEEGNEYHGFWEWNLKNGLGILKLKSAGVWLSEFKDDKWHGASLYLSSNKTPFGVIWDEGALVNKVPIQ